MLQPRTSWAISTGHCARTCVTDWPGREGGTNVYDRGDGTYGLLINQEIDYATHTYRLWDCELPEP